MVGIRSFEDLKVWQESVNLVEIVYFAVKTFPADEKFALASQIKRASCSVAANIAEGHPKTISDYIRHLVISIGSLHEVKSHILIANRLKFCANENTEKVSSKIREIDIMLKNLIFALKKRKNQNPLSPIAP